VDHGGEIAAVVEDQVERFARGEEERLLDAPIELFIVHSLPRVDRDASLCDRARGVILRGENVAAAPGDFSAELFQRFDEHGGLDRHVQAAGDTCPFERLGAAVLLAESHKTWHLVFGERDFFAAPFGETIELGGGTVHNFVRHFRGDLRHGDLLKRLQNLRSFYCKWRTANVTSGWRVDGALNA
jgi:hypothetical protein